MESAIIVILQAFGLIVLSMIVASAIPMVDVWVSSLCNIGRFNARRVHAIATGLVPECESEPVKRKHRKAKRAKKQNKRKR